MAMSCLFTSSVHLLVSTQQSLRSTSRTVKCFIDPTVVVGVEFTHISSHCYRTDAYSSFQVER